MKLNELISEVVVEFKFSVAILAPLDAACALVFCYSFQKKFVFPSIRIISINWKGFADS